MIIEKVLVRPVIVPMKEPHKTAVAVIESCPLVLITLLSRDGATGAGIIFAYNEMALKSIYELASRIAPLLEGETVMPMVNSDWLAGRFKLLGLQGVTGMVLSAVDMALWDLRAKSENKSLNQLMSGTVRPVKLYGNVGFDGIDGSAEGAAKFSEAGFLGVKAKIGYETLEDDVSVVRAMREAVGPDVHLMVDYNQSFTVDDARQRLLALKEEGLTWIEEPVYSHDFEGYVSLLEETGAPLQAGENWWGPSDFKVAIHAGIKGLAMPDVQKCGGVTGWIRISRLAEEAGIELSSHLWPEVSAQMLSVTPTAGWLEYVNWFDPILTEPLKIDKGYAVVEGVIGSGVTFDEEAVEKYHA